MVDRDGDKTKQPPGCRETEGSCPNMRETSSNSDMDGETYICEVCGARYRLYYEDMT